MEGKAGSPLQILGVTVLTSFDESDLRDYGHSGAVEELVDQRVRNAATAGVEGIVCSPVEVAPVRRITRTADSPR